MTTAPASPPPQPPPTRQKSFVIKKARTHFFGLTLDETIRAFFGGNAFMAVVVLALITVFLFREGSDFVGQNRENLMVYRKAGLEYVDYMRAQQEDHTALTRYLFDIRLQTFKELAHGRAEPLQKSIELAQKDLEIYATKGTPPTDPAVVRIQARLDEANREFQTLNAEVTAKLADFDDFAGRYSDTIEPIRGFVSDLTDVVVATKEKFLNNRNAEKERDQYLAAGMKDEAAAVQVTPVDFKAELAPVIGVTPAYIEAAQGVSASIQDVLKKTPAMPTPALEARMKRFVELNRQYLATYPETFAKLKSWDFEKPIDPFRTFTSFLFGREWITASFWQDWYGVVPLFVGSLMVSVIALFLAVPLGVGAAIYINQFSNLREQRFIKPAIEFISAIPSVVLGFFGIAVLGSALRTMSQWEALSWVPGFPFSERLNALTAGCLLALIAVPTIFTLAEDALNNVPRSFKEASFALGASRMQTILRIIVPASLSGIVSAVLLGLGRVIGETMVVLLCAGNRIAIPDFTKGLGVIVQPVHTMTGIIAQEMGEVVRGEIHYRALFMVGLVLFFIALLINFLAQKIVRKYRVSIG
jgi:phosphate transport system permease protein